MLFFGEKFDFLFLRKSFFPMLLALKADFSKFIFLAAG